MKRPGLFHMESYGCFRKIGGTSKSSILMRFSIINHPFWGTPIFGNTHISSKYLSTFKTNRQFAYIFVYLSDCLSICRFVSLRIYLPTYPSSFSRKLESVLPIHECERWGEYYNSPRMGVSRWIYIIYWDVLPVLSNIDYNSYISRLFSSLK